MEMVAPRKQERIAAHRAPKVRMRDRVKLLAFAVHMGAWACWQYNRRLFWMLVTVFTGLAFMLAAFVMLVLGVIFQ